MREKLFFIFNTIQLSTKFIYRKFACGFWYIPKWKCTTIDLEKKEIKWNPYRWAWTEICKPKPWLLQIIWRIKGLQVKSANRDWNFEGKWSGHCIGRIGSKLNFLIRSMNNNQKLNFYYRFYITWPMLFIMEPWNPASSARMVDLFSEIQPISVMEQFPNGHGVTIVSKNQNVVRLWFQNTFETCIHVSLKHLQFKHALAEMIRNIYHLSTRLIAIPWMRQRYYKRLK